MADPDLAQLPDPWHWNVAQIITYFCHPDSRLASELDVLDRAALAVAIERHQLSGQWILRMSSDIATLKTELGVNSLRARILMEDVLQNLRRQSPIWLQYRLHCYQSHLQQPDNQRELAYTKSGGPTTTQQAICPPTSQQQVSLQYRSDLRQQQPQAMVHLPLSAQQAISQQIHQPMLSHKQTPQAVSSLSPTLHRPKPLPLNRSGPGNRQSKLRAVSQLSSHEQAPTQRVPQHSTMLQEQIPTKPSSSQTPSIQQTSSQGKSQQQVSHRKTEAQIQVNPRFSRPSSTHQLESQRASEQPLPHGKVHVPSSGPQNPVCLPESEPKPCSNSLFFHKEQLNMVEGSTNQANTDNKAIPILGLAPDAAAATAAAPDRTETSIVQPEANLQDVADKQSPDVIDLYDSDSDSDDDSMNRSSVKTLPGQSENMQHGLSGPNDHQNHVEVSSDEEIDMTVSKIISPEQACIEEAKKRQVAAWKRQKLPGLQLKAYTIWTSVSDKEMQRTRIANGLDLLFARLAKLEKELLGSVSLKELPRMCATLDVTVFEIQRLHWTYNLLRRATKPEKPADTSRTTLKKQRVEPPDEGSEDLTSEDESIEDESASSIESSSVPDHQSVTRSPTTMTLDPTSVSTNSTGILQSGDDLLLNYSTQSSARNTAPNGTLVKNEDDHRKAETYTLTQTSNSAPSPITQQTSQPMVKARISAQQVVDQTESRDDPVGTRDYSALDVYWKDPPPSKTEKMVQNSILKQGSVLAKPRFDSLQDRSRKRPLDSSSKASAHKKLFVSSQLP